jgi:hypothetical protein
MSSCAASPLGKRPLNYAQVWGEVSAEWPRQAPQSGEERGREGSWSGHGVAAHATTASGPSGPPHTQKEALATL